MTFGKCAKTFQYRKITFLQILKIRHLQAQNEHEPYILHFEEKLTEPQRPITEPQRPIVYHQVLQHMHNGSPRRIDENGAENYLEK